MNLPFDIIYKIAEELVPDGDGHAVGSLAALTITCRSLSVDLSPLLYKWAVKKRPSLMFWACEYGHVGTVSKLLAAGADPNLALSWTETGGRDWGDYPEGTSGKDVFENSYGFFDEWNRVDWTTLATEPVGGIASATWGSINEKSVAPLAEGDWKLKELRITFPVHVAVYGDHLEIARMLIKGGARLDVPSRGFSSTTHLTLNPEAPQASKVTLWHPLHVAIVRKNLELVQLLIESEAHPFISQDESGVTMFHTAAQKGNIKIIDTLFSYWETYSQKRNSQERNEIEGNQTGANFRSLEESRTVALHLTDDGELCPLWYAYLRRKWDAVAHFISLGADIDTDAGVGYTPLIDACAFGDFKSAKKLVDLGADVNMLCLEAPAQLADCATNYENWSGHRWFEGYRPLDLCCRFRESHLDPWRKIKDLEKVNGELARVSLIKKLLATGAAAKSSPGILGMTPSGIPPLIVAAAGHQFGVIKELIKNGVDVRTTNQAGVSALMAVIAYQHFRCGMHHEDPAIEGGGDDGNGASIADNAETEDRAAAQGSTAQDATDTVDAQEIVDCSIIRVLECLRLLLDEGADVNAYDAAGNSALSLVSFARPDAKGTYVEKLRGDSKGYTKLSRLLLERGANPDVRDTTGISILRRAFEDGNFDTCRILLNHKATVQHGSDFGDPYDDYSDMFLYFANVDGDADINLDRLDVLSQLDDKHRLANDPIFICQALTSDNNGLLDMILKQDQELLKDTIAKTYKGSSALHHAVKSKRPERVRKILAMEPDVNITNEQGFSALFVAVKENCLEIVEALLDAGAEIHISDRDISRIPTGGDYEPADAEDSADMRSEGTRSPVICAIRNFRLDIIQALFQRQPLSKDVSLGLHFDYLTEACNSRHEEILRLLLKSGVEVNATRTGECQTALLWMFHNIDDIVNTCAKWRDIKRSEDGKQTSLRARLRDTSTWFECVNILIKAGATVTDIDAQGKTAINYARELVEYKGSKWARVHLMINSSDEWRIVEGTDGAGPSIMVLEYETNDENDTN